MTNASSRGAWGATLCATLFVVAGCAAPGNFDPAPRGPGTVRTPNGQTLAPQAAFDTIGPGTSTQSQVAAALGPAFVVRFDSGYEVWVYRWPGADKTTRGATELVLLFDPAGTLTKRRLRPGYVPRAA